MRIIKFLQLIFSSANTNIDLITDRHIHTFFDKIILYKNRGNNNFLVNQSQLKGAVSGGLNLKFCKIKNKSFVKDHTVVISKKTRE